MGKVWKHYRGHADEAEEATEQLTRPELPDTVIFQIVAGSNQDLDAAVAAIDEFIDSEFTSEVRTFVIMFSLHVYFSNLVFVQILK